MSPARRGITLTEVLISLGILTLGLLGAMAMFPVGSFYMQRAEISDRGAAIAQSVMADLQARGMLNPAAWYVMTPGPPGQPGSPNQHFPMVDGKYVDQPRNPPWSRTSTFTRPFAEALAEGLRASNDPVTVSRQFGSAYLIDPMYAAAATFRQPFNNNRIAYPFPASAFLAPATAGYYGVPHWSPWRAANFNELTWPIRRVTFQQADGWHLNATMAEHYFRGSDDLAIDLPQRDDRPAQQPWDATNGAPLARQWVGDYSWIVSVTPTSRMARDGMARNPESYAYDVSVVVFYKRVLPAEPPQTNAQLLEVASSERSVKARVVSTGLNGGELLLEDLLDGYATAAERNNPGAYPQRSPFYNLRNGQWIMLCGPHPASTDNEPRFVLQWYQVMSIDTRAPGVIENPATQRLVTVRGPQWPWQPADRPDDNTHLSNNLCAGIIPGAVAVHTKTMRLPSSSGSWGSGVSLVDPRGFTEPPGVPKTK